MVQLLSAILVAFLAAGCQAGLSADGGRDYAREDCSSGQACVADGVAGRCSLQGHCVYPVSVKTCAAELRYASGACVLADSPTKCGCADDGNPCTREVCADGECVHPSDYAGNSCPDGLCFDGVCCGGCWDGVACHSGQDRAHCGSHGNSCTACPLAGVPPDPCRSYSCAGACISEPVNGPGCPHCGSMDELCCAGSGCDPGLQCVSVPCGEDCVMLRCRPR